jgi:hypothetical protein
MPNDTRATPDHRHPVSTTPPGRGPASGTTSSPLGGGPHPAAPDSGRPDTRPVSRDPHQVLRDGRR